MNLDDEVFKNFLVEMGEKLEELENGLAELEEGFSEDELKTEKGSRR